MDYYYDLQPDGKLVPRPKSPEKLKQKEQMSSVGDYTTTRTFNIAPKNRQPQKETSFPIINFQGLCQISGGTQLNRDYFIAAILRITANQPGYHGMS